MKCRMKKLRMFQLSKQSKQMCHEAIQSRRYCHLSHLFITLTFEIDSLDCEDYQKKFYSYAKISARQFQKFKAFNFDARRDNSLK